MRKTNVSAFGCLKERGFKLEETRVLGYLSIRNMRFWNVKAHYIHSFF